MIAAVVAICLALLMMLALVRLFIGPTLYDRALAATLACVLASVACAAVAVAGSEAAWTDAAFAIALSGLVLNVAALKFFRTRTMQAPLVRGQDRA